MTNKFIALALAGIVGLSGLATTATAQHRGEPHRYEQHRGDRDYRYDPRDRRDYRYDRRDHRRDYRRYQPRGYYGQRPYYYDYGRYSRGEVYPHYRDSRYIVNDYHRYGLPAPQRGYRYYRSDNGDIVMAAIAGGIIGLIIGSQ